MSSYTLSKRSRMRGFSCTDELWLRILKTTEGAVSASSFIRKAIIEELERFGK